MSDATRFWERLVFLALLFIVMWLPVPFGSNTQWASALLGVLVAGTLGLWGVLRIGSPTTATALRANRWMVFAWLAWLGWIALQLYPFSFSALEFLSPYAARQYLHGYPDSARTMRWTISIDPGNTYKQLLLSTAYFSLYLLVLVSANTSRRLRLLAGAIVVSGLAQAVYGSLMTLSGTEYGFLVKKTAYLGAATGTFVNRNHLAGYLEISAAVGVGLIVADLGGASGTTWRAWLRDLTELAFSRKLRLRVFVAAMVIAIVLTRSRMGNVAFFVSLMGCGLIYMMLRERRLFLRGLLLFASILLVDLLIVSKWFGLEQVVQRVGQTDVQTEARAQILPELTEAVDAYWLTGAGLGNFGTAFLPFRKIQPWYYYDHAHNDYAQFMIETGIIGSALLLALALVTLVHSLRVMLRRRNRLVGGLALAYLIAIGAIAIHSAVDFNLQIPANAATLVVVMAMINSCSHQGRRRHRRLDRDERQASDVTGTTD